MRGHGLSTNPSGEYTHRQAAMDLLALLDSLGIESVVGVGHSSGAVSLLDLALMAPSRLSAMVFIGGSHRYPPEVRSTFAAADAAAWKENLPNYMKAVASWHPNGEDQLELFAAQVRSFADTPGEGVHEPDELRSLSVPTLIAHGERDEINPPYLALELYNLLPRAELWLMPNVTHAAFVSHWVHPGDLACQGCGLATRQFPSVLRDFLHRNQELPPPSTFRR